MVHVSARVFWRQIQWNPNAGDEEVIAALKDLIDSLAAASGRPSSWSDQKEDSSRVNIQVRPLGWIRRRFAREAVANRPPIAFIACHAEARAEIDPRSARGQPEIRPA